MPRLRSQDTGGYNGHRIDESGRIVLSPDELEALGDAIYIIKGIEDCVRLCTAHGIEETKKELAGGELGAYLNGWTRRITAFHVPRAVKPDGNGRVRLPGDCLDHAKIGRGTSLALVMPYCEGVYEVWDKAHFETVSKEVQAEILAQLRKAPAQPSSPSGE